MQQQGHEMIRRFRERRGWTYRQFAERAGVHHSGLCQLEHGQRPVSIFMAKKLAKVMGVAWHRLCE